MRREKKLKKNNIILVSVSVSVLLALSLASCSDNGGQAENTHAVTDTAAGNSNGEVSEEVSEEAVPHEKVYEHPEDFFGRLDDDSKRQVELIASKIPELKG